MASSFRLEQPDLVNYFDQFSEYEVNLTKVLSNFSSDDYKLQLSNSQPVKVKMKNLFSRFDIITNYTDSHTNFVEYTIEEYERIDQISSKLYGIVDYWWVILIINRIKNPIKEWPLSQEQLNTLVDLLYKYEGKYKKTTYYNLLFESNEQKKKILVPKNSALYDIIGLFREIIQAKV